MFRRSARATARSALAEQRVGDARRGLRYSTLQDSLKPIPGQTAGTLNVMNEICINPDNDEERKRPAIRAEVRPRRAEHSYLATMWKWGYNSLTLFRKVNEDPGPWWNANNSTLTSNWSQIGEYCNAGLWSGIWRYTYGVGIFNLRPGEARKKAWGRRDAAKALHIQYAETLPGPTQLLVTPHLKEHVVHKRIKNPDIPGFTVLDPIHGKRVLREVQYNLSQGIRYYLIDGVFGSHTDTATPFRIITDNPTHAYFASIAAIRGRVIVDQQEIVLLKRVNTSPLEEWAWRRPGVLVLHCPSYDFELPRIVEEFGGPRPQDLGLKSPKFVVLEPYSIPMKGLIGADPTCSTLLRTVAQLCARWGFYADDKAFLTLPSDSVLSADGKHLTVVISLGRADVDSLRSSGQVYGAHHHRVANGIVSRAWDATTVKAGEGKTRELDLVEDSLGLIQRPLPTRIHGDGKTVSHRFYGRRNIAEFGYKRHHLYTNDAKARAVAGGHLFAKDASPKLLPRPSGIHLGSTTFVLVTDDAAGLTKADSASFAAATVDGLAKADWAYAEPEPLQKAIAEMATRAAATYTVGAGKVTDLLKTLADGRTL